MTVTAGSAESPPAIGTAAAGHGLVLIVPVLIAGRAERLVQPGVVLFLGLALALGILEVRAQRPESVDREPLVILGGLGLLAVFWVGLVAGGRATVGAMAGGAALLAAGIACRLAAIRALGPWFASTTTSMPGQPRVGTGIYRWLRHPSEIGLVAIAAGSALLLDSPAAGWLVALVVGPAAVARCRREEAWLSRAVDDRSTRSTQE